MLCIWYIKNEKDEFFLESMIEQQVSDEIDEENKAEDKNLRGSWSVYYTSFEAYEMLENIQEWFVINDITCLNKVIELKTLVIKERAKRRIKITDFVKKRKE